MNRLPLLGLCLLFPAVAAAELEVVVVEGLGGDARYTAEFADQVGAIEAASAALTSGDRITVFRSGDFTRDEVRVHFADLGQRLRPDDRLAVFLIGHGSFDDHEYKFNIAGPDLTGADLLEMLDGVQGGNQLLVNTSSSSGAIADLLQSDRRTLILATRSGAERHATRFGTYFFQALSESSADVDKSGVISAAEAFGFAERQVDDYFERNGQLATEHPRVEGARAARFSLGRLGVAPTTRDDAELSRMLARRQALNDEVESLRLRRDTMSADEYQSELLGKMLDLATLEDAIERREAELDVEN